MVKIRLKRIGTAKRPYYRIVAVDSRKPRDGEVLEELGYYRPVEQDEFKVDQGLVKTWVERGAQLSIAVKNLFRRNKIVTR